MYVKDGKEYWNPIEFAPRDEIQRLQLKKLKETLRNAYHLSPFYHRRFREAGVMPDDIKSFDDFKKMIPTFSKDDIREDRDKTGDPFGSLCCGPREEGVTVYPTTGTSGIPTFVSHSDAELNACVEALCRSYWMMGIRPNDKMFTVNLTWHWVFAMLAEGLQRVGVKPILYEFIQPITAERIGIINKYYQADLGWFPVDIVMALRDEIPEHLNCEPKDIFSSMRLMISGTGESVTPGFRQLILDEFGVDDVFDFGGCSEGRFTYFDCPYHNGGHLWDDLHYYELVDPDTYEPIDPASGERGDLTVTTLSSRHLPYIRMRTEDISNLYEEPCECGRTHTRVVTHGRLPWRLNVGGKQLLPDDIRRVVEKVPGTRQAAFAIVKDKEEMDRLKIEIHYDDASVDTGKLEVEIKARINEELGLDADLTWVSFYGLPFIFHKIERVLDRTKR